jgi:hypothetical protein
LDLIFILCVKPKGPVKVTLDIENIAEAESRLTVIMGKREVAMGHELSLECDSSGLHSVCCCTLKIHYKCRHVLISPVRGTDQTLYGISEFQMRRHTCKCRPMYIFSIYTLHGLTKPYLIFIAGGFLSFLPSFNFPK